MQCILLLSGPNTIMYTRRPVSSDGRSFSTVVVVGGTLTPLTTGTRSAQFPPSSILVLLLLPTRIVR